jgi:hypothetical protein
MTWLVKGAEEWAKLLAPADSTSLILTPIWFDPLDFAWKSGDNQWLNIVGIQ